MPDHSRPELSRALDRMNGAIRPHTRAQYQRQFRLYIAFLLARGIRVLDGVTSVLLFLEFLAAQSMSSRVICNYISALKHYFLRYSWRAYVLEANVITNMLRGIKLSVHKPPTPKPLFTLQQLSEISRLCYYFPSPAAFRAAYLVAFFGFFRISNIAPPFRSSFDPTKQLLRSEVLFAHPGCHLPVKWAKNIQAPERALWCKLPSLSDPLLCPVTAIEELLRSVPAPPSGPLFTLLDGTPLSQSALRKRLTSILQVMRLPPISFGFHTFRRSAASIAFNAQVLLQAIQIHGHWRSDAVWSYISANTSQSLQVPLAFQNIVASTLP